jgi:hypothetical protein
MSDYVEVQRIDRTGTIWFAATLISVALPVAALFISGWRPADLDDPERVLWWVGATITAIGLAAIGYAGCPIYWGNVSVAHLQKSIAIRAGLVCFLIGSFVAVIAVLTG